MKGMGLHRQMTRVLGGLGADMYTHAFSISMCVMLVQCYELWGRRFTNFHFHYCCTDCVVKTTANKLFSLSVSVCVCVCVAELFSPASGNTCCMGQGYCRIVTSLLTKHLSHFCFSLSGEWLSPAGGVHAAGGRQDWVSQLRGPLRCGVWQPEAEPGIRGQPLQQLPRPRQARGRCGDGHEGGVTRREEWVKGWMDGQTDGWTDGQTDGQMNGLVDEQMDE